MAATVGEWLTVTGDQSGAGVKHQCKMVYVSATDKLSTPNFNWAVMGDFTVTITTHDYDPGEAEDGDSEGSEKHIDIDIMGSVDGTNYVELDGKDDIIVDTKKAGAYVYDFDSKGLMPHMRIDVDPDGTITSQQVWVTVTSHHMV